MAVLSRNDGSGFSSGQRCRHLAFTAVLAIACAGEIGDGVPPGSQLGGAPSTDSSQPPLAQGGTGAASGAPSAPPPVSVSSNVTRVARLTHEQYDRVVFELLGVPDSPASGFAPDALNGFAFDTSIDYRVDARLGPQYRAAAEVLAERAVNDDTLYARLVGCDTAVPSCAGEFVDGFGQRAFRRPLSEAERTRFAALFARGDELVGSGDAFRDGVRLVVEAALQSPQFLYRTELSAEPGPNGKIALDDWEVASRLSFAIWNSMPDAPLFERAREGGLRTDAEVELAARRLLDDPKAMGKLLNFHEQAWQFGRFSKIAPDREVYPEAPADLAARVRAASHRFVEAVIQDGGGLAELLTAPYAFADAGLAPLYDASLDGELARIDFPNGERRGFLMQVGFLASNAHAIKTDPIHRGLFVLRDLLCRAIPDPPPGASTTAPPPGEPPKTTREEVSRLTEQAGCDGCHHQINPPGFAFEGFDAVGRARSSEGGTPVDTSGSIDLDGRDVEFGGADGLVEALGGSEEARRCYTAKWLAYVYGHDLGPTDDGVLTGLAIEPLPVRDLLVRIASSTAMRERSPNQVAP